VKVKLDENIPVSLVETLASLGHDVQTVIDRQSRCRDLEAVSA
jgi:Domain of unknown function (DUF5615)